MNRRLLIIGPILSFFAFISLFAQLRVSSVTADAVTFGSNHERPEPAAVCTPLIEGFDDISTLPASGWSLQNHSEPIGFQVSWFQGNDIIFAAQSGAATSYISANFHNGGGTQQSPATISNWLLTPPVTLQNGATITFYTRT